MTLRSTVLALMLATFGAATLAVVLWRFEETLRQRNPQALQPATLLRTPGSLASLPPPGADWASASGDAATKPNPATRSRRFR